MCARPLGCLLPFPSHLTPRLHPPAPTPSQEVTTPVGQLAFATPELLAARGVPEERRRPEALLASQPKALLTPVEEIAGGRGQGGLLRRV